MPAGSASREAAAWLSRLGTFTCEHYHCRMDPARCLGRQQREVAGWDDVRSNLDWCTKGRCRAGAALMVEHGFWARVACPSCDGGAGAGGAACQVCAGHGWVPDAWLKRRRRKRVYVYQKKKQGLPASLRRDRRR